MQQLLLLLLQRVRRNELLLSHRLRHHRLLLLRPLRLLGGCGCCRRLGEELAILVARQHAALVALHDAVDERAVLADVAVWQRQEGRHDGFGEGEWERKVVEVVLVFHVEGEALLEQRVVAAHVTAEDLRLDGVCVEHVLLELRGAVLLTAALLARQCCPPLALLRLLPSRSQRTHRLALMCSLLLLARFQLNADSAKRGLHFELLGDLRHDDLLLLLPLVVALLLRERRHHRLVTNRRQRDGRRLLLRGWRLVRLGEAVLVFV